MSELSGKQFRIEDDLTPQGDWIEDFAQEGIEQELGDYLARHMDFARFCIAKARATGNVEELREWGEDTVFELPRAA